MSFTFLSVDSSFGRQVSRRIVHLATRRTDSLSSSLRSLPFLFLLFPYLSRSPELQPNLSPALDSSHERSHPPRRATSIPGSVHGLGRKGFAGESVVSVAGNFSSALSFSSSLVARSTLFPRILSRHPEQSSSTIASFSPHPFFAFLFALIVGLLLLFLCSCIFSTPCSLPPCC